MVSSLKKQQKKLITKEIASRVMEYLMGLNEDNLLLMQRLTEKSSKKLVNAYFRTIKTQRKEISKASAKVEKENRPVITAPAIYTEQTNLIAS